MGMYTLKDMLLLSLILMPTIMFRSLISCNSQCSKAPVSVW